MIFFIDGKNLINPMDASARVLTPVTNMTGTLSSQYDFYLEGCITANPPTDWLYYGKIKNYSYKWYKKPAYGTVEDEVDITQYLGATQVIDISSYPYSLSNTQIRSKITAETAYGSGSAYSYYYTLYQFDDPYFVVPPSIYGDSYSRLYCDPGQSSEYITSTTYDWYVDGTYDAYLGHNNYINITPNLAHKNIKVKVTIANPVFSETEYASASNAMPWVPAASACHIWIDGSAAHTITLDASGKVQSIADRSNNGFTLYAQEGERPTITTNVSSGRDSIFFASTDTMTAAGFDHSGKYICLAVVNPASTYQRGVFQVGTSNSAGNIYLHNSRAYSRPRGAGYTYTPQIITTNTNHLITVANANLDCSIRVSGYTEMTCSSALFTSTAVSNQQFRLGALAPATYLFGGQICELIFVNGTNAISGAEILEGYLAHKWNAPLISGHPYYSSPP